AGDETVVQRTPESSRLPCDQLGQLCARSADSQTLEGPYSRRGYSHSGDEPGALQGPQLREVPPEAVEHGAYSEQVRLVGQLHPRTHRGRVGFDREHL